MKDKKILFIIFLILSFIFIFFCLPVNFGGVNMSDKKEKWFIFIFLCIIIIVSIAYLIFFYDEEYNYYNVQTISDSGITLIYKNKNEESKICFVKYYDKSNLNELLKNLKKGDIIYIPKNTPIDKEFFDSMNTFGVDYSIRFPNDSTKIEIIGK